MDQTHLFLSKLEFLVPGLDTELLDQVANERELLKSEIEHLRVRAKVLKGELENIWQDETKVAYELTSVFIHRGSSPSWGRYFFYS
jgi:ubiquitin carboxyl-terminal hydrolase 25